MPVISVSAAFFSPLLRFAAYTGTPFMLSISSDSRIEIPSADFFRVVFRAILFYSVRV